MTLEGFCPTHQDNVAINIDRRCLTDSTFAIAPSTLCAHRRWTSDGWSECLQERPCPPRSADAWRAILGQQAAAVKKRDRDWATRQFAAANETKPKLATAHKELIPCPVCTKPFLVRKTAHSQKRKTCSASCGNRLRHQARAQSPASKVVTQRAPRIPKIPCPICTTPFVPASMGAGRPPRQTCSAACGTAKLIASNQARAVVRVEIPCPVCQTPFVPHKTGRGTPSRTCSVSCARKQGASTRDTAEYRAKLAAAATGRSTSDAHREHLSQSISRYHAERRSEMAS